MKLAFSTLGVPGLPIPDVVRLAADNGYQGVELRAHPEEHVHSGLSPAERAAVAKEFRVAQMQVLAVAGYVRVAEAGADGPILTQLRELLALARDLDAPYVRVFPGGGDQTPSQADATAARRLAAVAADAHDLGVRVLLETHDSHRTAADACRVLGLVGHLSVGAIWDVLHTWLGGEEPVTSHAALAPHLGYVQVKDVASANDTTPLPLGEGVLPLRECLTTLVRANFADAARPDTDEGWVCWEYEKRWHPEAAELPPLLGPGRDQLLGLLAEAAAIRPDAQWPQQQEEPGHHP
ncbi:sugar phosphate isomerase/epimerase family protein [Streptomyces zagrosensis]|uniref:Sugar phosphate isomerase/epimerase n=1 Tax=Streptomyces zagrosensis TaxID=1042984 RepID=A0A7W9UY82_9ACTN|nr:sugar phosphate isomerase/epimerase family protein [Streptomyces zagrosensis]MBB5935086.1 sugar phosphate isomerase/epimerase [Streptomyces zagrosensis]